jgi:peptidoglycan/LPS O-acetylase OafA/YrhL
LTNTGATPIHVQGGRVGADAALTEAVAKPATAARAQAYPDQINALTSLRYLAASWVVFFHLREFTRADLLAHSPFASFGYLGVDFFFVLSGFVLTHVYKRDVDAGRFDYWGFITKRFGRIYPMHLVTLVAFIALGLVSVKLGLTYEIWDPGAPFRLDKGQLMRGLITHLTLIHAWGSTQGLMFNLPSWSISAEWFAYLQFPIYMVLFKAVKGGPFAKLAMAAGLFVVMAGAAAVALRLELTRLSWNMGVLRILPEFLLGVGLYVFGQRWSAGPLGARIGLALCGALVAVALVFGSLRDGFVIPGAMVAVLGLAGIVLFAADADRCGVLRPLSAPFFVLLGEVSYSVYMLHLLVGIVLFEVVLPGLRPTDGLSAVAMICGALVVITALSWASYTIVEVPGRRAVVRWARKLNQPAA